MKRVIILFITVLGLTSISVLFGRGELPKEDYFNRWVFLMPENRVVRIPRACLIQTYESYYNPTEQHYYCPNFADNIRTVYISLENGIVDYISFRPVDLRYGDLIAMYGQPTEIRVFRNRVSSVYFGSIYAIIADKRLPISYETQVLTIGFTEAFRRNR